MSFHTLPIHVLVLHQSRSYRTVLNNPELSTSRIYSLNFPDREQVKSGMQSSVISEKNVQLMCDSPFVVKLYAPWLQDFARVKLSQDAVLCCVKEQEQFIGLPVYRFVPPSLFFPRRPSIRTNISIFYWSWLLAVNSMPHTTRRTSGDRTQRTWIPPVKILTFSLRIKFV